MALPEAKVTFFFCCGIGCGGCGGCGTILLKNESLLLPAVRSSLLAMFSVMLGTVLFSVLMKMRYLACVMTGANYHYLNVCVPMMAPKQFWGRRLQRYFTGNACQTQCHYMNSGALCLIRVGERRYIGVWVERLMTA